MLPEASNNYYSSMAGESLELKEKKIVLYDFISFLSLYVEILSCVGIKYQHYGPIIKLRWRKVACSEAKRK